MGELDTVDTVIDETELDGLAELVPELQVLLFTLAGLLVLLGLLGLLTFLGVVLAFRALAATYRSDTESKNKDSIIISRHMPNNDHADM